MRLHALFVHSETILWGIFLLVYEYAVAVSQRRGCYKLLLPLDSTYIPALKKFLLR